MDHCMRCQISRKRSTLDLAGGKYTVGWVRDEGKKTHKNLYPKSPLFVSSQKQNWKRSINSVKLFVLWCPRILSQACRSFYVVYGYLFQMIYDTAKYTVFSYSVKLSSITRQ
jgi:hypothetical protein